MYPLSQRDVWGDGDNNNNNSNNNNDNMPTIDFTPSSLITLLFTDLGGYNNNNKNCNNYNNINKNNYYYSYYYSVDPCCSVG